MISWRRSYPLGDGTVGYERCCRLCAGRKYWRSATARAIFNVYYKNRIIAPSVLDESTQMIRLAKHRLEKTDRQAIKLVRGLAQALPFPEAEFDSVISTFPSDYIFDPDTLSGIHRVLRGDGRFILVPAAWIVGRKLLDRAAAWLFRITGETPRNIREVIGKRAVEPLKQAGFNVEVRELGNTSKQRDGHFGDQVMKNESRYIQSGIFIE